MNSLKRKELGELLTGAEWYFKLAFVLTDNILSNRAQIQYFDEFIWGNVKNQDFKLSSKQEEFAAITGEHGATYISVLQVDNVLEQMFGRQRLERETSSDVRNPSVIANLLRNSFAHNPLKPKWKVNAKYREKLIVPNVIALDASDLDGKSVARIHYGGPLAILKLLHWTRDLVLTH